MSSTTPRGYRYPEPGDIFAPRQWIENLANDVDDDANSFVSVVGTPVTGNSLTFNGTAWVPGAAAGVIFGTTANTAAEGNDPRLSNARTPTTSSTRQLAVTVRAAVSSTWLRRRGPHLCRGSQLEVSRHE